MPTGTGYYDINSGTYRTLGVNTWDDFDGSSPGNDWDGLTTWFGESAQSLQFTSDVQDQGIRDVVTPVIDCVATAPVTTTVYYGDTMDSSGGAIDSPSSVTITPNQANVGTITGRFFQFQFDISKDSAGDFPEQLEFSSFAAGVDPSAEIQTISNLDTSTLGGSVGARQLDLNTTQTVNIKSICVQPLIADLDDTAGATDVPVVFVDKQADPPVLNIFDIDAYGKRRRIDCTVDIMMYKLVSYETDENGNTQRIT